MKAQKTRGLSCAGERKASAARLVEKRAGRATDLLTSISRCVGYRLPSHRTLPTRAPTYLAHQGEFEIGRILHLKSEIGQSQIGRTTTGDNVQFTIVQFLI